MSIVSAMLIVTSAWNLSASLHAQDFESDLEDMEERAFQAAAAMAQPSMVRIETVGGIEVVDNILTPTGPTTGVVASADGYVLSSAFNFISKPASIVVTTYEGRKFPARLIANDHLRMLSLLKIEAQGLIPLTPADEVSFRPGRWAIALGWTYDAESPNLSVGIISAVRRVWGKAIQTDAKISPVNYGGPLVDLAGHALGILVPLSPEGNSATSGVEWYDSGIGFAIPIRDALDAANRMKAGADLHVGLMGISFSRDGGVAGKPEIDRVQYGSPAQQAGLIEHDLITAIEDVAVQRIADVRQQLGTKYADDEIAIAVRRGDQSLTVKVHLVAELLPYESGYLGILPLQATVNDAGVSIRYVFPESPASQAGLERRDRIVQFQDQPVKDFSQLQDLVSRTLPNDKITLTIVREKKNIKFELQLASIPNEFPPVDLPTRTSLASVIEKKTPKDENVAAVEPTGRLNETLPGREDSYWAYIPGDYDPRDSYGLVVWIHPQGDTHEAIFLERCKSICDTRRLILLGPKSERVEWSPEHVDFVKEAIDEITRRYNVDPYRKVILSYRGAGGFAQFLVNKEQSLFAGVAMWESPLLIPPPDHEPDHHWQWYLGCHAEYPMRTAIEKSTEKLREMKYPAALSIWSGNADEFPLQDNVEELARWIDALDRL
ncbi:MAG: PDZ domain-containing protein [Planctomycetota bacterium]|nr:PDZ domain-containing protein [Planctomycetota bacterium]MDA1212585.1 PDZ domain-containing protein [Planctomycetota bacterium]